jgi:hypothetical protein
MAENITLAPVTTFTNDSSAVATVNANSQLIQNAFTNVLDRYGSSPNSMQAVLDMNSFSIVNLPAPATINSPARLIDVVTNPTISVPPVGTSGSVVGLLNGNNTYSGTSTFTGAINSSNTNTWSGVNNFTNASNTAKFNWVQAPALVIPIEEFGGVGDNSTDNTTALNAIIAAFPNQSIAIGFGKGTYRFASSVSYTLPNAICCYSFLGLGADVSILNFASGTGLSLTYTSYYNSATFQNLSIVTRGNGTGTGVTITQTGTTTSVAIEPITNFTNVTFRGADGYVVTNYWSTCVSVVGASDVYFTNCYMSGPAAPFTTVGKGFTVTSNSNSSVCFCFSNCIFNYMGTGIEYGNLVQGLIVSNCNFTGCNFGINVVTGSAGNSELSVTNSQFNCATAGINCGTAVPNTTIIGNTFFCPSTGSGVFLGGALFTIIGNSFIGDGGFGNGDGIIIANIAGNLGGIVSGNSFDLLNIGIWIQTTGHSFTNVTDNFFFSFTTGPVIDASLDAQFINNIGVNPVGFSAVVPGVSPWTYTASNVPETHYMSASTSITALTLSGSSILPAATGANVPMTVQIPPHKTIVVTYTGTLTDQRYIN